MFCLSKYHPSVVIFDNLMFVFLLFPVQEYKETEQKEKYCFIDHQSYSLEFSKQSEPQTFRKFYQGVKYGMSLNEHYLDNQILHQIWIKIFQILISWEIFLTHQMIVKQCNMNRKNQLFPEFIQENLSIPVN